jgi:NAD(P)-dependent dehydrogenase (short-subunit alcohol dehydrogenase family)
VNGFGLSDRGGIIMKLKDKVAVITGAARGIGKAIAERYAKEGAQVVIADLNEQAANAAASAIGPNAYALKLDVTDQASIDAMVAATVAHFGGVDILVNNAGSFDLAPIVEITRESYRRVYAVNVEGLLFTLQAVAKQMIRQGRGGKIINFASQAGRRGEALVAIYCSSKAAVISFTQSAGLDLIKHHIRKRHCARRRRQRALGSCRRDVRHVREPQARREETHRWLVGAVRAHGAPR